MNCKKKKKLSNTFYLCTRKSPKIHRVSVFQSQNRKSIGKQHEGNHETDLTRINRAPLAAWQDNFKLLFLLLSSHPRVNFWLKGAIQPARNCPIPSNLPPSIAISANLFPGMLDRLRKSSSSLGGTTLKRVARKTDRPRLSSSENSPRTERFPTFHLRQI